MPETAQSDPGLAVCLAWQPFGSRAGLSVLFQLDERLAAAVAQAREPMLAQVRLAWWRERLSEIASNPASGEPLLARVSETWGPSGGRLAALVDGWEHLVGEPSLSTEDMTAFATGRAEALRAFANHAGAGADADAAASIGRAWAFADLAVRASDEAERKMARSLGSAETVALPRSRRLRGVAVLGGLSARALLRGEPIMEGRGAAAAAMRLGLFGR
ncbi:hypothetical protein [Tsuneonella deserti]|nr:hypothetical protein [Tsuneonella deserti]